MALASGSSAAMQHMSFTPVRDTGRTIIRKRNSILGGEMARVPVITSPCPFRWKGTPQTGQDFCGQCQRQVHNLDGMSISQKDAFFAGCAGEVCVAYTVRRPVRVSIAAVGLAAMVSLGGAVAAEESPAVTTEEEGELLEVVVVGGTVAGDKLQWVDEAEAATPDKPELPQISEIAWLPTPKV
jgi:hypothetical protein